MLTLDYVQDPGHGWLAADRQHLRIFGLLDKISAYSYQDGADLVWLEEDCDAPRYVRALREAGIQFDVRDVHTRGDAWIRSLPRYQT